MNETNNPNKKMTSVMIGLEIHVYLNTKSKLFCSCSTDIINAEPNSVTCPVCLAHPGSKPVLNAKAVEHAIKVGLALNCKINNNFFFSRKTYFYPDMSANYQITQYEVPVAENGFIKLGEKKVRIRRAHLELDPAALIHPQGLGKSNYSLIDYNRSGFPLLEIVTEPDFSSPLEARGFLNQLETILSYLNVLMPNMTMKADCNISINGGNRVEIKNVSGFQAAEKALAFELARQKQQEKVGNKIEQCTRLFNADTGQTVEARKKETEEDYGYIFDPDLVKVFLNNKQIEKIRNEMPELPQQKIQRFVSEYNLNEYESNVLCNNFDLSKLFEELMQKKVDAKITSNLLTRELLSILNHDSLKLNQVKIKINDLQELILLIKNGKVSDKNVKQSLINYISGDNTPPKEYLEKNGLLIKEIDLESIINNVLEKNNNAVLDYKKGNNKVINFLAGLVMRETKGSARIEEVLEKLKQKISE
ncbi:MAG: Asp-tRNA(Asn)/Glu-tRNA(Gln) amidotransferase subunit GatB [Candidatus ainarchaeum sp.]|nr:Asp-tRNA(Asn)/Glu-tRNA(Gln) amidotransferase subunit GatB [Candidatus ainarchaeum sp.]